VDQADLTSNETIKKNQTMDTTMRENYEIERYAKIINLLKIDMIAKQDSEKSTRKKYNKILKAFNLMKKENDDVRQSFFSKEQNFHKIINQLNQDLVKAKNCLAEYISLSEWINICGSDTMKDKCVHEIERIRKERCRAFEAKSANYLNRDSFMLDETLGGSGTFSPKNEMLDNPDGAKYQSHMVNAKKVKVNRTYDSNQNIYTRKITQNSQELAHQPNYPSFNSMQQAGTGDMFKKKIQQGEQTEGSIDLGHWGKDPGMDGDNLGIGLMAESQRTLAERQGQFESCLPSYPSLKSLDGDELEYFKHKCTALIYRNEELREELQNSKANLELIKAQVDLRHAEFGQMAQGIKRNIDATVGRQNQYLTAGTPTKNLANQYLTAGTPTKNLANQYLTAGTPTKNLAKDKGLQTPYKTSVHNVGPPSNIGISGISGTKGKNPGAG
jgi:hypothetical protein